MNTLSPSEERSSVLSGFLMLLAMAGIATALALVGLGLIGEWQTREHPDRYGFFPDMRPVILASMGAQRDRLDLATSPSSTCLDPHPDPGTITLFCEAFAVRGTPVTGDLSVLDDYPLAEGFDASFRWWRPHPRPTSALWVSVKLPAQRWALAHRLALAGRAQRPERFTLDTPTLTANTQRSAQQALGGGHGNTPIDALRVINASADGLTATALFNDGLTLPMSRTSLQTPWTILSQGPFDQLQPLIADLIPSPSEVPRS